MSHEDRSRRELDDLLAILPTPEPPRKLRGQVLAAVRARPRLGLWRRLMPIALGATAVLAVVLLRPSDPAPIPVGHRDLQVESLVGYHTVALASDPLSDPIALTAIGADAMRRAVGGAP